MQCSRTIIRLALFISPSKLYTKRTSKTHIKISVRCMEEFTEVKCTFLRSVGCFHFYLKFILFFSNQQKWFTCHGLRLRRLRSGNHVWFISVSESLREICGSWLANIIKWVGSHFKYPSPVAWMTSCLPYLTHLLSNNDNWDILKKIRLSKYIPSSIYLTKYLGHF